MGLEATCVCDWNGTKAEVKALIEPPELILRGGIRRRVPLAAMKKIRADGNWLRFTFDGEAIALDLGSDRAARWAKALMTPPPSLAKRLGISAESVVRMIGSADDKDLEKAISERFLVRGLVFVTSNSSRPGRRDSPPLLAICYVCRAIARSTISAIIWV